MHSTKGGFALVELLMAITLAVVITAFITQGLGFELRAWETDRRSDARHDADLVDHAVAAWLTDAIVVSRTSLPGGSQIEFRGGPSDIEFVALSDGRTRRAGLLDIRVGPGRSNAAESRNIVVETAVFRRGPGRPDASEVVLAENASAEFYYFGSAGADNPSAWRRGWDRMESLPSLVAFRLLRSGRPNPPATIVRLRGGDALPRELRR